MSEPMNSHPHDQSRGQALVELAIVIPIIVVVALALFDGGRAVLFYTELTNASRVGARVAMVNQSHDASCTGADQTYRCAAAEIATSTEITPASIPLAVFTDRDGNVVNPTDPVCLSYGECSATVSASYAFTPITPIVSNILGSITLNASTTMAIERTYASP
ncbi:MAG: TadE/TadG family type IV pilus assembly protein [Chloroflexota bacterium]|jgi:Flp pilus assembly protein TadG